LTAGALSLGDALGIWPPADPPIASRAGLIGALALLIGAGISATLRCVSRRSASGSR
jgi:hypothetical protein